MRPSLDDGVDLDRRQPGLARAGDAVEDPRHREVHPVHRHERLVVERVEADGHAAEAGVAERSGEAAEGGAVRGQRQVHGFAGGRPDLGEHRDEVGQVAPDEGLATGDPELLDAERHERPGDPDDLLEAQDLIARQEREVAPVDLLGHAVHAPEVAAVGDADAEVVDASTQPVRRVADGGGREHCESVHGPILADAREWASGAKWCVPVPPGAARGTSYGLPLHHTRLLASGPARGTTHPGPSRGSASMATTETRSGFRLPWGADQRTEGGDAKSADAPDSAAPDHAADPEASAAETAAWPSDDPTPTAGAATGETSTESDATHDQTSEPGQDHPTTETTQDAMLDMNAASTPSTASTAKRPTKFLADLTKAMRGAAEAEREEIVGRFAADAKAFTELIQERSGTEATELRKRADDDVAAVRDWSKAEIARIREETDERIAHRRTKLDREVEGHAARIEQEIERVKSVVDSFEKEMALFFEELVSEEDPSRFASLAGHLPEPPSLDDAIAALADVDPDVTSAEPSQAVATEQPTADAETPTGEVVEAQAEPVADGETIGAVETVDAAEATSATATTIDQPADAGDVATAEEAVADADPDPRVAALGLTPDFAAAEAEALADVDTDDGSSDGDGSGEAIPALDDETIAARLAGLVPPTDDAAAETASTRLIVTGLVSVASIAGFKRHLARLAGVRSVGVSSGPDGEFVFAVNHDAAIDLRDVVPTMPGFGARVTGSEDGTLTVSATDPESDS